MATVSSSPAGTALGAALGVDDSGAAASSLTGAALGAALGVDDSGGATGSLTPSGTAAAAGVVDAAGGISSSDDVELSDEAACWGAHHSLRGSGSDKTETLPGNALKEGGTRPRCRKQGRCL